MISHPIDSVAFKVVFGEDIPLSIRIHQDLPIQARCSDDSLLELAEVAIGGIHGSQHTMSGHGVKTASLSGWCMLADTVLLDLCHDVILLQRSLVVREPFPIVGGSCMVMGNMVKAPQYQSTWSTLQRKAKTKTIKGRLFKTQIHTIKKCLYHTTPVLAIDSGFPMHGNCTVADISKYQCKSIYGSQSLARAYKSHQSFQSGAIPIISHQSQSSISINQSQSFNLYHSISINQSQSINLNQSISNIKVSLIGELGDTQGPCINKGVIEQACRETNVNGIKTSLEDMYRFVVQIAISTITQRRIGIQYHHQNQRA
ncbi:predicted protein [Lichtheimia corymbifera JMRC:FSU:9682]|uniref:Uncharacterized protein n=1 Tax=Lichtheimia corymbifera JMRC:FSU:9682 TaxID=1263082 RepID=A0A068SG17_9FUNG|nr:predicted protein [Lichtheimia corymbifera JMRC:FSU:9682]